MGVANGTKRPRSAAASARAGGTATAVATAETTYTGATPPKALPVTETTTYGTKTKGTNQTTTYFKNENRRQFTRSEQKSDGL